MIEIKHKINEKPSNIIHGIFQKYELENLVRQGDSSGYFTHKMGVTPRQPDHLKNIPSEQMTSSYYVPETGYLASKEEQEFYRSFMKEVGENETALGRFTHDKEEKYLTKDGMIAAESEQEEYKKLTAQRETYKNTYADVYGQKFGDNKGLGFVRTTNYQKAYGILGTALTVTGALTANPALAGAGLATLGLNLGKTPLDSIGHAAKGLLATGLFAASLPFYATKGIGEGISFIRASGMILRGRHLKKIENSTRNFGGDNKKISSVIQERKKQRIEELNKSLSTTGIKPVTEEEVKYRESIGQSKGLSDRSIIADMLKEERGRKDGVKKFLKNTNVLSSDQMYSDQKDNLKEALKLAGVDDSNIDRITGHYISKATLDYRIEEARNILKSYANSATAKIEDFDKFMINAVFNDELFEMDLKNPFTSLHLFNEKKKQLTKQINEEGYNYYKKNFEDTRAEYLAGRATIKDVIEKAEAADFYAKRKLGAKTENTKTGLLSELLAERDKIKTFAESEEKAVDDFKNRFNTTKEKTVARRKALSDIRKEKKERQEKIKNLTPTAGEDKYEEKLKALGLESGATEEEIKQKINEKVGSEPLSDENAIAKRMQPYLKEEIEKSADSEAKRLEQQIQEKEKELTEKKAKLQQLEKPSKLDEEASKKKAELEARKQVIEKDKVGIKTQLADSSTKQKTEDELYKKLQSLKEEEIDIDKQLTDLETQRQTALTEANKEIRKGAGVGRVKDLERQKQQKIEETRKKLEIVNREKAKIESRQKVSPQTVSKNEKQRLVDLNETINKEQGILRAELQKIDKEINYTPESLLQVKREITTLEEQLRTAKEEKQKLEQQIKAVRREEEGRRRASIDRDIKQTEASMSPKDLKTFRKARRERLSFKTAANVASKSINKLRPEQPGYGNRYVQSFLDVMSKDGDKNPVAIAKKLKEMSRMANRMSEEKGGGMHYGGYGAASSTSFFAGAINSAQDEIIRSGGTISAVQRFRNMLSIFGAGGWAYDADNFLLGVGVNPRRFKIMAGEVERQGMAGKIMGGLMKHATAPGAMLYMGSLMDEAKKEGRDMTVGEAALASGLGFALGAKAFTFFRQGTLGVLQAAKGSVRPIGDIIGKNKAGLPLNTFGKIASRTGKIATGTAGLTAGLGGFLGGTIIASGAVGAVRMFADSNNWINRMVESSLYRNSTFDHNQTQMSLTMRQRQLELISRSGLNNRGALLGNEAMLLYSQAM